MSPKAKGLIASMSAMFLAWLTYSLLNNWGTMGMRALVCGAVAGGTVTLLLFPLRKR
jgi:hypothetical protein